MYKRKTARIFPNAIEVVTKQDEGTSAYFFTSFVFRDAAFRLAGNTWQNYISNSPLGNVFKITTTPQLDLERAPLDANEIAELSQQRELLRSSSSSSSDTSFYSSTARSVSVSPSTESMDRLVMSQESLPLSSSSVSVEQAPASQVLQASENHMNLDVSSDISQESPVYRSQDEIPEAVAETSAAEAQSSAPAAASVAVVESAQPPVVVSPLEGPDSSAPTAEPCPIQATPEAESSSNAQPSQTIANVQEEPAPSAQQSDISPIQDEIPAQLPQEVSEKPDEHVDAIELTEFVNAPTPAVSEAPVPSNDDSLVTEQPSNQATEPIAPASEPQTVVEQVEQEQSLEIAQPIPEHAIASAEPCVASPEPDSETSSSASFLSAVASPSVEESESEVFETPASTPAPPNHPPLPVNTVCTHSLEMANDKVFKPEVVNPTMVLSKMTLKQYFARVWANAEYDTKIIEHFKYTEWEPQPWTPTPTGCCLTRFLTYIIPLPSNRWVPQTRQDSNQCARFKDDSTLILETCFISKDVPMSSCFEIREKWVATQVGEDVHVDVSGGIIWKGNTWGLGGVISSNSLQGIRNTFEYVTTLHQEVAQGL